MKLGGAGNAVGVVIDGNGNELSPESFAEFVGGRAGAALLFDGKLSRFADL